MPKDKKKRKNSSDSDSDSGDSGKETKKPPAKKQATSTKSKGDKNEPQWHLSADKLVTIREFKGKLYIDIRQYYNSRDGEFLPTKKGISLTPENYQSLKKLIGEIDEELAKF